MFKKANQNPFTEVNWHLAAYKPRGGVLLFGDSSCTPAHHPEGLDEGKSTPRPFPRAWVVVPEPFPHKLGAELREGRRGGGAVAPGRHLHGSRGGPGGATGGGAALLSS